MERRPGRRAKRFWSEGICGAALSGRGSYGGGCAERGGGSKDGSHIAGILNAGEHDNQRGCDGRRRTGNIVKRKTARDDKGCDALRLFRIRDAFKEAIGGTKNGNGNFAPIEVLREARMVAFTGFTEKHGADG